MDPETRSQSILRVEWDRGDLATLLQMSGHVSINNASERRTERSAGVGKGLD